MSLNEPPLEHPSNTGTAKIIELLNGWRKEVYKCVADLVSRSDSESNLQTPTLLGSWVNYNATFQTARYWKDVNNVVHLEGMVKSGSGDILTLPTGYRPALRNLFASLAGGGVAARVDVLADGTVTYVSGGTNAYVSLSGITFLAS